MSVISSYKSHYSANHVCNHRTNILVFITFVSNHLCISTRPTRLSQREKKMHRLESFSCHCSHAYYYQFIELHHKFILQSQKPKNACPSISFYSWHKLYPPTWQTCLYLQCNLSLEIYFPENASQHPFLCTYLKDFLISSALIVLRISWYNWRSFVPDGVSSEGQFICA